MDRYGWVRPLILFGLFALLAAFFAFSGVLEDRKFFVSMPISNWLFMIGILAGAGVYLFHLNQQQQDQIRLDEQEKGQRERLQFLRRLDHELKNPLTAMQIQLANLAQANGASHGAVDNIRGQVGRISSLVTDLRKLSDLETREMELSQVNVELLLTELYELMQESATDHERSWQLTIPQAPWPVPDITGDYDLLFLAVFNLLENAVKYSRDGDRIELRAAEGDGEGHITIEVADTGPGIEPADQPYIFEELYRGKDAQQVDGSGLGLSLVNAIVRRHGGTLSLRSRPGEGTVIRMLLPVRGG